MDIHLPGTMANCKVHCPLSGRCVMTCGEIAVDSRTPIQSTGLHVKIAHDQSIKGRNQVWIAGFGSHTGTGRKCCTVIEIKRSIRESQCRNMNRLRRLLLSIAVIDLQLGFFAVDIGIDNKVRAGNNRNLKRLHCLRGIDDGSGPDS